MVCTLTVESVVNPSPLQCSQMAESYTGTVKPLSISAQKIYNVLVQAAEKVKEHRQYHKNTSQVTLFCPLEIVALVAGVSRRTVYNRLPELRLRGLVHQTGHYCTLGGQTRQDGSIWSVRISGEGPLGIDFDWLKKSHRNLGADIEAGRTAFNLAQSYQREKKQVSIDLILSYAIAPTSQESINNDCANGHLEELIDIPFVPVEARNAAVDRTARTIARELGSTGNLMFWRWLIWQLIRLEQLDKNRFYQVFLYLQRVRDEKRENSCNNPAGLFVSRLKKSFIWAELREVPLTRVSTKPFS